MAARGGIRLFVKEASCGGRCSVVRTTFDSNGDIKELSGLFTAATGILFFYGRFHGGGVNETCCLPQEVGLCHEPSHRCQDPTEKNARHSIGFILRNNDLKEPRPSLRVSPDMPPGLHPPRNFATPPGNGNSLSLQTSIRRYHKNFMVRTKEEEEIS
ncbi:hypothetical protein CEXT_339101 [Caerostris extrusa]|uniref:Uncharacterized protein n=1 Tax=Caerostris extrusa TaxID=172846 RepID=A0AAV4VD59_CAEEX|nr:hypothetical protein CEXT_339101 [Caerostris extrusa]